MTKKYIVFKDDDVGKNLPGLKRWTDIIIKNDAKATVGLIGKHLTDKEVVDYLKSLDDHKIEVFCHGFSHSYLPFLLRKIIGRNKIYPTEFDRNYKSHSKSLGKYRNLEGKHLNNKALTFGPPGNVWNDSVIPALVEHGFKAMFSWRKIKEDLYTIPLTQNYHQETLRDFKKIYKKNKDKEIFTLQFHHANLSDKQFELLPEVIDFLKKEGRVFVTPSELLKINL